MFYRAEGSTESDINAVNPGEVDKLLAEELNQLSLLDRERVMEEIHGVKCSLSSQEGISQDAIVAMQEELDMHYLGHESDPVFCESSIDLESSSSAVSSSTSSSPSPSTSTSTSPPFSAYREARSKNSRLILDLDFLRSFLIADRNDPKKAALRLMRYLDYIRDLFDSPDVLLRPIFMDDLHPKVRKELVMGSYQILPDRDSSGRRVFCYLRDLSSELDDPKHRHQLYAYFHQRLFEDDSGMVAVVFLHNSNLFDAKSGNSLKKAMKVVSLLPSRYSAIHLCLPDHPMFNVLRSAIMLIVGKDNRSRIRLHIGSLTECQYNLSPFGIPVSRLPAALEFNTTHRKDNIANHTKWLRIQRAKEIAIQKLMLENQIAEDHPNVGARTEDGHGHGHNTNPNKNRSGEMEDIPIPVCHVFRSKFVECPRHEDCLFGRGRNTMKHPGNVAMRRLLEEKQYRYSVAMHHTKAEIAWEVVNAIKDGGGRFLKESKTGLYTLVDDEMARKKISIAFRDLKSKNHQKRLQQAGEAAIHQENQATYNNGASASAMSVGMDMQEFAKRQKFSHTHMSDDSVPQFDQCFHQWL